MSIFLISYIVNFISFSILGYLFLRRYRNLGGLFFGFFSFFTGLWMLVFMMLYGFIDNHSILEKLIQFSYAISTIALLSFIYFLKYFGIRQQKIFSPPLYIFLVIIGGIISFYLGTDYIVDGLYFNQEKQDWYEVEGKLFLVHSLLNILFIPGSIYFSIKCLKRLRYVDRKRFQFILLGMIIFATLSFLFLLIIGPIFGVWVMERYVGFFSLPFMVGVFYSMRRYDFLNFKIILGQAGVFLYAILCTYFIIKITSTYTQSSSSIFQRHWGIGEEYFIIELFITVSIFIIIYKIAGNIILPSVFKNTFVEGLESMKKHIPFIQNTTKLNAYISGQFSHLFQIGYAEFKYASSGNEGLIERYFLNHANKTVFINDKAFIQEQRGRIFEGSSKNILRDKTYLAFPVRGTRQELLGVFYIGPKLLYDPFFTSEINALKSFAEFLGSHLKYISIYSKINELNVNLDKKVDEKTIEYNNLINRQKEFIAYVSHEIRNPITNSLFLCDSLIGSFNSLPETKNLEEDIFILNNELLRISELTKKMFSVEKYDLQKIQLFKEHTDISNFIRDKVNIYQRNYPHIDFNIDIDNIENVKMDRVQLGQVFQNLLENSIKFVNKEEPQIKITLKSLESGFLFSIEDNGEGFQGMDITQLFDKYSTGESNSIGLGLGLYLCKRIVELHGWSISATNSDTLGGAKFTVISS